MKIGVCSKTNYFGKLMPGDDINYIDYLFHSLRKKHEVILFNWRNVSKNLDAKDIIVGNSKQFHKEKYLNLSDCDLLFLKQLGKVYGDENNFVNFLNILRSDFSGRIINPLDTMIKGFNKNYLFRLQKEGLPVIPTKKLNPNWKLEKIKKINFDSGCYHGVPNDYVIKPIEFGEKGESVRTISSFDSDLDLHNFLSKKGKTFLIQPYMESIKSKGENSFIFLGKNFSHAVNKLSGDFLINWDANSPGRTKYSFYNPTRKELGICNEVLDSWPDHLGYSRIDFIYDSNQPFIGEVEVVNPSFYVENLPGFIDTFIPKLGKFLEDKIRK
ncbi:MAG: RimK family alpha-L-glutamate ligase [Candidatus Thorarchaeota archaeon]